MFVPPTSVRMRVLLSTEVAGALRGDIPLRNRIRFIIAAGNTGCIGYGFRPGWMPAPAPGATKTIPNWLTARRLTAESLKDVRDRSH